MGERRRRRCACCDFMPPRGKAPDVVRIVEGMRGSVRMRSELVDPLRLRPHRPVGAARRRRAPRESPAPTGCASARRRTTRGENMRTISEFIVEEGERVPFVLTWFPSHEAIFRAVIDPEVALSETETFWREWVDDVRRRASSRAARRASAARSCVLKALIYGPTGGIVAAPTTSLPEWIGGVRNWDYRYCWLRDATLTLLALLQRRLRRRGDSSGARWLLRAVAGDPADIQIMYGVAGERRLTEFELPWLPGYEGSAPVRVGNAASEQLQIDVFGELMDALYQARVHGPRDREARLGAPACPPRLSGARSGASRTSGIWEIRGEPRHFVHSKVMAWVAFDRAVRSVEEQGLDGPVDRWRASCATRSRRTSARRASTRSSARSCSRTGRRSSTRASSCCRSSAFCRPPTARMRGTIEVDRAELVATGSCCGIARTRRDVDGLPAGEGVFLPCSFWLVDCLELLGRHDDAHALFERLIALVNDVGLHRRGVRPGGQAHARQLPPGVHAPRARQLRIQRRAASAVADEASARRAFVVSMCFSTGGRSGARPAASRARPPLR